MTGEITQFVLRGSYQRHPLSQVWPDISKEEMDDLVEDIKRWGVQTPVVMYRGLVLDGWHRLRAAVAAGRETVPVIELEEGEDAAALVISANARRRQMSKEDVAVAVLKCREMDWAKVGRPPKKARNKSPHGEGISPPVTVAEVAEEAGVSVATVERAKQRIREEAGDYVPKPPKPKAEISPTNRQSAELQTAKSQIQQMRKRTEELCEEVDELTSTIQMYKDQQSPETGKREAVLNGLRAEVRALKSQNGKLGIKLADTQERAQKYRGELRNVTRQLERCRKERDGLAKTKG